MRALRAEGGAVTVAGMHHGVVAVHIEDATLQIVHERGEIVLAGGVAGAAGEQRIAGEQVGGAISRRVGERDRAGSVADNPDDVEVQLARLNGVPCPHRIAFHPGLAGNAGLVWFPAGHVGTGVLG